MWVSKKRFDAVFKLFCHHRPSPVFLVSAAHCLLGPSPFRTRSFEPRRPCSSLSPLVCWLLCLSDLDLSFLPLSHSLPLPPSLLSLWFSRSLSNPLNFSQFPLYASRYFSLPPWMSRLLSRPLAFFRSLMPRSSDRQPVKSGPCVNMTELNANAGEKQANLTQTEDSLQPLPLLPLLMHPAPSAKPQCTDARASAKQEKTHTLNAFITASINFNPNSDILN